MSLSNLAAKTYLRFDDTNPLKESDEYVEAIKADVQWLGFEWTEVTHASDYFEEIYNYAVELIKADKAFVCSLERRNHAQHSR